MIDGRRNAPGFRWHQALVGALLLAAICACPPRGASAAEPTPATEAVSGPGQEAAKPQEVGEPQEAGKPQEAQAAASADAGNSAPEDPEPQAASAFSLQPGIRYYVAMRTVSTAGVASDFSDPPADFMF